MIITTYLRTQGRAGTGRFNPLPDGHPLIGTECVACSQVFKAGDVTSIVALGPGPTPDERDKCRHGRFYTAVAVTVHVECATGGE